MHGRQSPIPADSHTAPVPSVNPISTEETPTTQDVLTQPTLDHTEVPIQGRAPNPHGPTLEEVTGPDEPPQLIRHTVNPRRTARSGAYKPPGF